mgnify:CR=1 FL=1
MKHSFTKGINLGGWMSQCDYSEERLDTFITEPDLAQIAAWGFDHVRLPIDYNVLLSPDGQLDERGFRRLDDALALCERHGLKTVLDLHKTPGFSFDPGEREEGFFPHLPIRRRFTAYGRRSQSASAASRIV